MWLHTSCVCNQPRYGRHSPATTTREYPAYVSLGQPGSGDHLLDDLKNPLEERRAAGLELGPTDFDVNVPAGNHVRDRYMTLGRIREPPLRLGCLFTQLRHRSKPDWLIKLAEVQTRPVKNEADERLIEVNAPQVVVATRRNDIYRHPLAFQGHMEHCYVKSSTPKIENRHAFVLRLLTDTEVIDQRQDDRVGDQPQDLDPRFRCGFAQSRDLRVLEAVWMGNDSTCGLPHTRGGPPLDIRNQGSQYACSDLGWGHHFPPKRDGVAFFAQVAFDILHNASGA